MGGRMLSGLRALRGRTLTARLCQGQRGQYAPAGLVAVAGIGSTLVLHQGQLAPC